MFRRTKTKLEKKDESQEETEQKSTKNDLSAGFGKLLGKKKNQEGESDSSKSKINSYEMREGKIDNSFETNLESDDKVSSLIRLIRSSKEKMLVPELMLSTGVVTYPLLEQIDEDPTNIKFLENLTSESIDLLEKIVYERIAICPQHPDSLEVNVRLYCPKCTSMDIEKLHLFEHKVCGYISETKNFGTRNAMLECPSCKKPIKDKNRELRIPAMWYSCHSCKEKFDDVVIKMYCRKFNHDFDTNMAGTVSIPGYVLKDSKSSYEHDSILISDIKDLLKENGFISEENYSLKGKSGHYHVIDLVSTKNNSDTIFTYIIKSENIIDESEINAKIIQILDCNPTKTAIIGHLSDRAKSIATRYDISIINSYEKKEVLSSFSDIVSNNFTTEKIEGAKQTLAEERLVEKQRLDEERFSQRRKLEEERLEAEQIEAKRLEGELLAERERLEADILYERKRLESERLVERKKFEEELLADKQKLEAERQILEEERNQAEQLEAERLAERKRLEEERKKVERIEAERLAERKKLEAEILSERKRIEAERLVERKKVEEERFADKLILEAERKRLDNERKKVEMLELERQKLEEERKKAEILVAEKLEAERKRKEEERKQAEKRVMILKKLEETENQLKALKSSLDSNDEREE